MGPSARARWVLAAQLYIPPLPFAAMIMFLAMILTPPSRASAAQRRAEGTRHACNARVVRDHMDATKKMLG